MEHYGMELILDLNACDITLFKRRYLRKYIKELCILIDMKAMKLTWWDYSWTPWFLIDPNPKTYGVSVVQFIMTSNITIHALPKLGTVYLNIFSCKEFNTKKTIEFTTKWFSGRIINTQTLDRG